MCGYVPSYAPRMKNYSKHQLMEISKRKFWKENDHHIIFHEKKTRSGEKQKLKEGGSQTNIQIQ